MPDRIRVTVWGENVQEHTDAPVRALYPEGMHRCIAGSLAEEAGLQTALRDAAGAGTRVDRGGALGETDVLTWWGIGRMRRWRTRSWIASSRASGREWDLIVLHSGHFSKVFKRLMGTSCSLTWRVAGEKERVWICQPGHPIAEGLPRYFELRRARCMANPLPFPAPDEQVFISWFAGGEVFRSGCTWQRGAGKIFYFSPGHELYPIYHDPHVRQILRNAVRWAAPDGGKSIDSCPQIPAEQAHERLVSKGPKLHRDGEAGFR